MKHNAPNVRIFGHLPGGAPVHAITLAAPSGLRAEILTYGGILRSLQVPANGKMLDVVLGFAELAGYLQHAVHYLGALVGRYCNRIRHARLMLEGLEYPLDRNFSDGGHHIHGGSRGFSHHIWALEEVGPGHVVLGHESPAGDQGYPGHLNVSARFELGDDGLHLVCRARTDATTTVNLTWHPYFNLSGNPALPADRQWLNIQADGYLPADAEGFPLGEIASVTGTPFDFRTTRKLSATSSHAQLRAANGYDHCLVLQPWRTYSAELHSPDSGISMRLMSSTPGLQLYGGQNLPEGMSGLCLEPQYFPDSPNFAHFPSTLLHPGQEYVHRIDYLFSLVAPGSI